MASLPRFRIAILTALGASLPLAPLACDGGSELGGSGDGGASGSSGSTAGTGNGGSIGVAGADASAGAGGAGGSAAVGGGGSGGGASGASGEGGAGGVDAGAAGGGGGVPGAAGGPCSGIDPAMYGVSGSGGQGAVVSCFNWAELATWRDGGSPNCELNDAGPGPYAQECRPPRDLPYCSDFYYYDCPTVIDRVEQVDGGCCYCTVFSYNCTGRPFGSLHEPRTAPLVESAEWCSGAGDAAPTEHGVRVAEHWRRAASYEHASVASFAQLALQLLAHGAPADLLSACQRAALDEVEHARLSFEVAARFDGRGLGPGPLDVSCAALDASLEQIAEAAVLEGCVEETISAHAARVQADRTTEPAARAALGRIAVDEQRHAELSWRVVQWALSVGGASVQRAVEAAFDAALREAASAPGSTAPELADAGCMSGEELAGLRGEVLRQVVAPCRAALLGAGVHAPSAVAPTLIG